MKIGDAVRVKVAGQRRLERGILVREGAATSGPFTGLPPMKAKVRLGLKSIEADPRDITVIHKVHEKETVIARVTSLQRAARALSSHRGNKRLASGDLGTDDSQVGVEVGDRGLLDTTR